MYTYTKIVHTDNIAQIVSHLVRDGAIDITLKIIGGTAWEYTTTVDLTAEQDAFISSFQHTHGQYDVTTSNIEMFLHGHEVECFDGYTQVADARNLWNDAMNYAALAAPLKETT